MNNNNSVIEYKNYGKIKIRLSNVLDAQHVSRYSLAKLTGIRYEVINKWYSGNVERADLDVLAKLCFALNCSVTDILVYNCD